MALKQVAVNRPATLSPEDPATLNRLVPYLDLFARLTDDELARLSDTDTAAVVHMRAQILDVDRTLSAYADLLGRLTNDELARLSGTTPKTVKFFRLCQPRPLAPAAAAAGSKPETPPPSAEIVAASRAKTAEHPTVPCARAASPASTDDFEVTLNDDDVGGHDTPS